jgi:hypothetical protein
MAVYFFFVAFIMFSLAIILDDSFAIGLGIALLVIILLQVVVLAAIRYISFLGK